ncbi:hypothetical protein [Kitasatospora herbaricolor]|uniref:hypothetical protein n=1 Tax=Kitasatospora herbaricolor TaxID=68217 RepID=UPI0036D9D607
MSAADRMAQAVRASRCKRVDFDDLAAAADDGDARLIASPSRRDDLARAAWALSVHQQVRLPVGRAGWDHSASPPLPLWVERLDPVAPRRPAQRPRAYVDALAFASRPETTRAERELLGPVSDMLRDRPGCEPVPLAERSYELHGHEKRLAAIHRHRLVEQGLLSVGEHLRAFAAPAPLALFEIGPAPWALIVENSATFTSLRRLLRAWPRREDVGWLGFGKGDQLVASIATAAESFAERDHPVTRLLLYGDLDIHGLECAHQAAPRARAAGLPELQPAHGLYRALLTRRTRAAPPVPHELAHAAASWLPDPLARRATDLLVSGRILPQEALPLPELRELMTDTPLAAFTHA